METKLNHNHEDNARFSFYFNDLNIELILGDGAGNEGWTVKLIVEPCEVSVIVSADVSMFCLCVHV